MTIETLKVGELARRTGVSVRALHHYDEIGLLSPSHRRGSGHRLYGPHDVEPGKASVEELIQTIEVITMFEKYYTPEQLEQLARRRNVVGEERIGQVEIEWRELFERFRAEMDNGTDPASEPVLALARKSRSLIEEFTGADPGIERSCSAMYRSEGGPAVLQRHGCDVDARLWEYMGKARAVLEKSP